MSSSIWGSGPRTSKNRESCQRHGDGESEIDSCGESGAIDKTSDVSLDSSGFETNIAVMITICNLDEAEVTSLGSRVSDSSTCYLSQHIMSRCNYTVNEQARSRSKVCTFHYLKV